MGLGLVPEKYVKEIPIERWIRSFANRIEFIEIEIEFLLAPIIDLHAEKDTLISQPSFIDF